MYYDQGGNNFNEMSEVPWHYNDASGLHQELNIIRPS